MLRMLFSFVLLFGSVNLWGSESLQLKVPQKLAGAKFESLSPQIAIRLGSTPFKAEMQLGPELTRNGKLIDGQITLRSKFSSGLFKTHGIAEERNNCVSGKETPVLKDNDEVTDKVVELSTGSFDAEKQTLTVPLQMPFMVEAKSDTFTMMLKLGEKSYEADLNFLEPYELHPVLAEMLKQYRKISATAIAPEFPPVIKRVVKDCDDTKVIVKAFIPQDRYQPKPEEVGNIGGYRVVKVDGWIFAAPSKSGPFPFEDVTSNSMTFLGDKYWVNLVEVKTHPNRLVAKIELGDFADCFGSGCGDPINVRDAYVTVTKTGQMSTEFKKHKKR